MSCNPFPLPRAAGLASVHVDQLLEELLEALALVVLDFAVLRWDTAEKVIQFHGLVWEERHRRGLERGNTTKPKQRRRLHAAVPYSSWVESLPAARLP
jgi:hypothetical protein